MGRISKTTTNGVLLSDQRRDQILLLQDNDGDGTASGPGETSVFLDSQNASGLSMPSANTFALFQASDKSVLAADGGADAVFRLTDTNGDGDAQDTGEARIWFSAANAAGFSTVTPNGVAEGADGAIYIANAGTGSAPQDAIYRTVDLNGDGDADDAGEATLWLDLQTIVPSSVPFDLNFDGDVAYLSDVAGGEADVIYRIEDADKDGTIQANEVVTFVSEDMSFGAPVDIANAVAVDGSLYTLTWFADFGETISLARLTDLDGSGQIDAAAEVVEVWNGSALPDGVAAEIGFSLDADEDGNITLTASSFGGDANVLTLTDLDGDGTFLGAGETAILGSDGYDEALIRPRAVEFYEGEAQVVASTVGGGNHFSVFLRDGVLLTTGENVVGQLGNGATGFDVKAPFPVEMPDGFDGTITSVSAGLIHTTFLTDDGDVYAFGFNNRGALGLGDEETRTVPAKVEALDDVDVIGIENGNGVSYALAADGMLWAWGNNSNGQLGLGDLEERLAPVAVDALARETIVAVSSGTSHTLALTADGQVYAFGSNTDGQIGASGVLGERRVDTPTLVEGLPSNILAVTADTKTSYAVTEDGRVFGWGESRNGQLLQGTDNGDGTFAVDPGDVAAPVELTGLPGEVIDVKGGARWAVALTADGDVWAWGPNDEGPTGGLDGNPAAESDASFYPTKIAALDDVTIVEIATGPNSIIAVADTGETYVWGSNSDGRLGFASDGPIYFPRLVDFDRDAEPFLVSATPADNDRDVETDAEITLTFTEAVDAGDGTITLVDRATGERTAIDVADDRLVQIDGAVVTVTPPFQFEADARYAIEISEGAFLDEAGQAYAGIAEGDTSTFNFSVAETAAPSAAAYRGTFRDDVLRGGSADDRIDGRFGHDVVSGGVGADRLNGGWGDDSLFGGAGGDRLGGGWGDDTLSGGADADRLKGGWGDDLLAGDAGDDVLKGGLGNDTLSGGDGDDRLHGGLGEDVFVFDSGHDRIDDFFAGADFFFFELPSDRIEIRLDGVEDFATLSTLADQTGRDVTFTFSETDSLTLRRTDLDDLEADMFLFA